MLHGCNSEGGGLVAQVCKRIERPRHPDHPGPAVILDEGTE